MVRLTDPTSVQVLPLAETYPVKVEPLRTNSTQSGAK